MALRHTCCDLERSRIFRKNDSWIFIGIYGHGGSALIAGHGWIIFSHDVKSEAFENQADRIFNILNELDNLETPGISMTFNDFHPYFQTIYCLVPETNSCAFR